MVKNIYKRRRNQLVCRYKKSKIVYINKNSIQTNRQLEISSYINKKTNVGEFICFNNNKINIDSIGLDMWKLTHLKTLNLSSSQNT